MCASPVLYVCDVTRSHMTMGAMQRALLGQQLLKRIKEGDECNNSYFLAFPRAVAFFFGRWPLIRRKVINGANSF